MHLVTLNAAGHATPGVVAGNDILDLRAAAALLPAARMIPTTMRALLEGGDAALDLVRSLRDQAMNAKSALKEQLGAAGALLPKAGAKLLAPVDPGVILAGGMNYHEHLKEMDSAVPDKPVSFVKSSTAVIGPGAPIVLPKSHPDMVDWEGEFSAVFGKPCFNVKASEAIDYLAGYTLVNDVSARDWVAPIFSSTGIMGPINAWEHNLLGKQYPTFAPLGPTIATRDEIKDPENVSITTTLNGKVMQSANTDDLVFSLRQLIEYYSQFYRFRPGDVITTGSPSGVGYGRNPKVFMKAGDVVEVKVDAIGTLTNPIVAE